MPCDGIAVVTARVKPESMERVFRYPKAQEAIKQFLSSTSSAASQTCQVHRVRGGRVALWRNGSIDAEFDNPGDGEAVLARLRPFLAQLSTVILQQQVKASLAARHRIVGESQTAQSLTLTVEA